MLHPMYLPQEVRAQCGQDPAGARCSCGSCPGRHSSASFRIAISGRTGPAPASVDGRRKVSCWKSKSELRFASAAEPSTAVESCQQYPQAGCGYPMQPTFANPVMVNQNSFPFAHASNFMVEMHGPLAHQDPEARSRGNTQAIGKALRYSSKGSTSPIVHRNQTQTLFPNP